MKLRTLFATTQLLICLLFGIFGYSQFDETSGIIFATVTTTERNTLQTTYLTGGKKAIVNNITTGDIEWWDGSVWQILGSGGGLSNVVEDLTPQLGGDLDAQNNNLLDLMIIEFKNGTVDYWRNGMSVGLGGDLAIFSYDNAVLDQTYTFDFDGILDNDTDLTTRGWVNTQLGNYVQSSSIDTFFELDGIVADKNLVNLDDNSQVFTGQIKFNTTSQNTAAAIFENTTTDEDVRLQLIADNPSGTPIGFWYGAYADGTANYFSWSRSSDLGSSYAFRINRDTGDAEVYGDLDVSTGNINVTDQAYNESTWNGSVQVPTKNAVRDEMEEKISSTTVGEPSGADVVNNIVSLTRDELANGTPVAGTTYAVTDPILTWPMSLSAPTGDLATGTDIDSFEMHWDATLVGITLVAGTAPTGANIIVDVNKNGTTVMTTNKVVIETTETNSQDATTQPGITTSSFLKGDVVSFDIDQIGSTIAGERIKIYLDFVITE